MTNPVQISIFPGGAVNLAKSQFRVNWDFLTKISTTTASTDSLSKVYMETKQVAIEKIRERVQCELFLAKVVKPVKFFRFEKNLILTSKSKVKVTTTMTLHYLPVAIGHR